MNSYDQDAHSTWTNSLYLTSNTIIRDTNDYSHAQNIRILHEYVEVVGRRESVGPQWSVIERFRPHADGWVYPPSEVLAQESNHKVGGKAAVSRRKYLVRRMKKGHTARQKHNNITQTKHYPPPSYFY